MAAVICLALPAWAAPPLPAEEPTLAFEVIHADTLIGLSREVLNEPAAWREVARLNRLSNPNRIRPGQLLQIPIRLLRAVPVASTLTSSSGEVLVGDAPAVEGGSLGAGQTVQTGAAGSAVFEFADGSRLRLPPSTLAQVVTSQKLGARATGDEAQHGWFTGAMRVLRGSVEVFASKVLRVKPLEVITPTAVVGVRGTRFRVGYDETANGTTRVEVVEGRVRFEATGRGAGADVPAGFGTLTDAAGSPPRVVKLLDAPDLSGVPERFERPLVRFAPLAVAAALRVQVAVDPGFDRIVVDQRVESGTEVRIAGLADASWHLRARRIDANGLEGLDATRSFVLKARPEPPAYLAPRSDSKHTVGPVAFAWAPNVESAQVRLQVAEDAGFTRLLQDRSGLVGAATSNDILAPGTYFWRAASIRPSGDAGPFGDPQRFEMRPTPTPPSGGLSADGSGLVFTWSGRPQDRQQVQLARDADFAQITMETELGEPKWSIAAPSSGRYYFRYRSVEADGFVSPYSSPLTIEVPRDWSKLWLLLPALLLI